MLRAVISIKREACEKRLMTFVLTYSCKISWYVRLNQYPLMFTSFAFIQKKKSVSKLLSHLVICSTFHFPRTPLGLQVKFLVRVRQLTLNLSQPGGFCLNWESRCQPHVHSLLFPLTFEAEVRYSLIQAAVILAL